MLYLYQQQPLKTSLFDIFEDEVLNRPLSQRYHSHYPRHYHITHSKKYPFNSLLEKQLIKALNDKDKDVFKLVEFSPKINLSEDEKNYYIHADLPGMTKDQVKMEINDDHILTISGERKYVYDSENSSKKNEEKEKDTENKMETDAKETEKTEKSEKPEENKVTEKDNESKKETEEINKKEKETEKKNNEHSHKKYSMIECSYGKFSRSFNIPENANLESIQAKMENGALEVVINKCEPPKNEKHIIQIQ